MKILLLLPLLAFCQAQSPIRYDNYEVYRVTPKDEEQADVLRHIQNEYNPGYDFWKAVGGAGMPVDIMVPPHLKYDFQDLITLANLQAERIIENVQTLIEAQQPQTGNHSSAYDWNGYKTLDEIYAWLRFLANEYPEMVEIVVGGRSYEGRDILGVKVSFGRATKSVFLEGGIHAREWIAPATVTFILNELLFSSDLTVRKIAESRNWYVFPVVNPDGYVYSHTSIHTRLWRKTRKPYGNCYGVDANRNWDYKWMHGGASRDPCSDIYAGSSAFSEVETKSLSDYISSIASSLDIYLSFHSYGELLLIPFGHDGLEVPDNNAEMLHVGYTAAEKLERRYETSYEVGNIAIIADVASGSSVDWVLGTHRHIRFVYTYELRDSGTYGFLLPPKQILPTGRETFDSVVSIVQQADGID